MQFNQFDNKVKEAANNHHPAYDEKAWSDMEKLLNKHLPQKQDDRKRFLFFLLLLIGLSGAVLLIAKPWKGNKTIAAATQTIQQKPPVISVSADKQQKEISKAEVAAIEEKIKVNSSVTVENSNNSASEFMAISPPIDLTKNSSSQKNRKNNYQLPASIAANTEEVRPVNNTMNKNLQQENDTKNILSGKKTDATEEIAKPVNEVINAEKKQNESAIVKNSVVNTDKPVIIEEAKTGDDKKEIPAIPENKTKNDKNKIKKSNSFFLTLSTGPDVSYAGTGKPGTIKLLAGGGIGYTIKERLTFRTGFYSGRKIYTASPDAYHPPAIFNTYYPNLEKVDANCKVYEIPISISYHFGRSSKQNWFAAAGISSYVMKSETYNYFYKYSPSGPTVSKKRTINNENIHYFSALTFSGGYLYNINKRFSFMVEPYLEVPLSGVGYGKVKLNSGGVLFSIGIKPFGSKKSATKK